MTDVHERGRSGFLVRQPFALLGAVGLLSLAQDLMQWQEKLRSWLDAFQAVTRPIWEFLLGWLPFAIPDLFKDYLSMGLVVAGMSLRLTLFDWAAVQHGYLGGIRRPFLFLFYVSVRKNQRLKFYGVFVPIGIVHNLLAWPLALARQTYLYLYWPRRLFGRERHPHPEPPPSESQPREPLPPVHLSNPEGFQARREYISFFKEGRRVYFESFIFALIIIALNFTLLYGGA